MLLSEGKSKVAHFPCLENINWYVILFFQRSPMGPLHQPLSYHPPIRHSLAHIYVFGKQPIQLYLTIWLIINSGRYNIKFPANQVTKPLIFLKDDGLVLVASLKRQENKPTSCIKGQELGTCIFSISLSYKKMLFSHLSVKWFWQDGGYFNRLGKRWVFKDDFNWHSDLCRR